MITDFWNQPVTVTKNNFVYKSLSNWACNVAVGCEHGCIFCYVPSASTIKLGPALAKFGVEDPDSEWGEYVLIRPWDEKKFMSSLRSAATTPASELKPDGNRAIMFCSTTDAYQTIRNSDRARQIELQAHLQISVRSALERILTESDLNVRILTRSPLARRDFDLMKKFGKRLLFGMSIPTLRNDLAKIYEPTAPAPSQRLATLRAAKEHGLNIYVAVAPVYPDCDRDDMTKTIAAIKELNPVSIFMEPINIRAENVARIEARAKELGVKINTEVFKDDTNWSNYALEQLFDFEQIAVNMGIADDVLHLWPDKSLIKWATHPTTGAAWLNRHWQKISAWPK